MTSARAPEDFIAGGILHDSGRSEPCTIYVKDGLATIETGEPERGIPYADFIVDMVNAHTHCADYGLKVPPGLSLEKLVAPPEGLKHRYLSGLDQESLKDNMVRFDRASASYGAASFIDFREGGLQGCRLLRECSEDAIILGRPISKEFDPEEVAGILEVADGIGLPSISDMDHGYIEAVADAVRDSRKIFAIHASERIREDIDFILSLDPAFVVHMCEATRDDMDKCAEAEVPVVVCPSSNRYFGKETPIRDLLDSGVDIAIGTDNGMLCEPDLVTESKLLADILAGQGGAPEDTLGRLSNFSSKLLYRTKRIKCKVNGGYLTVVPGEGDATLPGGRNAPFRVRIESR
jgi:hypothetical protein